MKSLVATSGIKAIALLAVVIAGSFSLVGCNTIEGAGKDVERAGEKVQDAAN